MGVSLFSNIDTCDFPRNDIRNPSNFVKKTSCKKYEVLKNFNNLETVPIYILKSVWDEYNELRIIQQRIIAEKELLYKDELTRKISSLKAGDSISSEEYRDAMRHQLITEEDWTEKKISLSMWMEEIVYIYHKEEAEINKLINDIFEIKVGGQIYETTYLQCLQLKIIIPTQWIKEIVGPNNITLYKKLF